MNLGEWVHHHSNSSSRSEGVETQRLGFLPVVDVKYLAFSNHGVQGIFRAESQIPLRLSDGPVCLYMIVKLSLKIPLSTSAANIDFKGTHNSDKE